MFNELNSSEVVMVAGAKKEALIMKGVFTLTSGSSHAYEYVKAK